MNWSGLKRSLKRPTLLAILTAGIVFLVAAGLIYNWAYAQRVYAGVRSANNDLGGLQYSQAQEVIQAWYDVYEANKISLRHGEREWLVAPSELGFSLDLEGSTRAAFAVGRDGNVIQNSWTRLVALLARRNVEPLVSLDETTARSYLGQVAHDIDRPVKDARLIVDAAGTVQVAPARPGEKLDVDEALKRLRSMPKGTRMVELPVEVTRPSKVERDMQSNQLVERLATTQPFTIQYEQVKKTFMPAELAPLLTLIGGSQNNMWPAYRMDMAPFRTAIEQMAKQVNRPPVEAKVDKKGTRVTVTNSAAGIAVDVEASLARVREQIVSDDRTVNLEATVTSPILSSAEVAAINDTAQRITGEPLIVVYAGQPMTVTRETLASSVIIKDSQVDGKKVAHLSFDDAKLKAMVDRMAETYNRPAQDANVRFRGGKVVVMEQAKDGLKVKPAETLDKLSSTLLAGKHSFTPEVEVAKASGPASNVEQIVVDELLMDAYTSYAGASPPKRHNVELATSRLDGILIAPGEVFSFNRALGPTRIADGYKMGWGIAVNGGEAVTIPSEAGGICQVATTLFQAVFWSGIKVAERWPHMYWIASYGASPRGLRGLDATVDSNTVDLRFENNTGNWVAIRAWTADSKVYFELWGKDPGWKVEVDGPKIEKIVPADREIIYRDDPSMEPGQQLQIEAAMDGFLSTINRTVTKGGKVVSELTVRSDYVASHNVILVHPRPATPTPEPSAPATAVPTATAAGPRTPTPVPTVRPVSTPRSQPTPTPKPR